MKGKIAVSTLIILTLFYASTVLNVNPVSAQTSNAYTVQSVEHTVEVMFSGHTVIRDEIKVSGSVANGFQIAIPSRYADSVLKVVAFDGKNAFNVEKVSQLGGQSGFYAVKVDFGGQNPTSFTVEFLLSNTLMSQYSVGYYQLDFPAYPSLTTTASQCKTSLSLPIESASITISKADGDVTSATYQKSGLEAFTSIQALASFSLEPGLLQLVDISTLNREVTISPSGEVTCTETYLIKNIDLQRMSAFMLNLPSEAKNVVVREGSGTLLSSQTLGTANTILLVNASLATPKTTGQSVQINAQYNLPGLTGNSFNLTVFPALNYHVNQAVFTLVLPEGASAVFSDSSAATVTNGFEQKISLTRKDVTYVDYEVPGYNLLQVDLNYNPLWASYKPTIIVFALSSVCCITIVFYKKRNNQNLTVSKKKKSGKKDKPKKGSTRAVQAEKLQATPELTSRFIDAYNNRRELIDELKTLETEMQKGNISRSQYKNQKHNLDTRIEALTNSINKSKEVFRQSNPDLADLTRQLELAEADLTKTQNRLSYFAAKRNTGQVAIEEYKKAVGNLQEAKEAANAEIDGILLRLREKMQ